MAPRPATRCSISWSVVISFSVRGTPESSRTHEAWRSCAALYSAPGDHQVPFPPNHTTTTRVPISRAASSAEATLVGAPSVTTYRGPLPVALAGLGLSDRRRRDLLPASRRSEAIARHLDTP